MKKKLHPKNKWFWNQLDSYLLANQLKQTNQRKTIVEIFLTLEGHIEADQLYAIIREQGYNIGLATVYRTLNLLKDAGLVDQNTFVDGRGVFEISIPGQHHDHLVCLNCGKIVEFENNEIEELQLHVAQQHGFNLLTHKLELYGTCLDQSTCQKV